LCLADGVTGLIDAGSQGADRISEVIAVAKSARSLPRPDQHRPRRHPAEGDTMDLARADVAAAAKAIGQTAT